MTMKEARNDGGGAGMMGEEAQNDGGRGAGMTMKDTRNDDGGGAGMMGEEARNDGRRRGNDDVKNHPHPNLPPSRGKGLYGNQ